MNPVNQLLLKLALLPRALYQSIGVDVFQLQCIVATKLVIDDRRPNTMQQIQQRRQKKPIRYATLLNMLVSLLLGAMSMVAFFIGSDAVSQFTIFFLVFIFVLASSLISDFTAVLIDVRDNYIILPKPVNDRTLVLSRLVHIFIHITKLIAPMLLPGLILVCVRYNAYGGLLLIVLGLFATVFSIFIVNAVYIVMLKITTPQKFQSVIAYFQIVFAVVIYASYQVVPRMLGTIQDFKLNFSAYPAMLLAPPYWFACAWKVLRYFNALPVEYTGAALALLLPVVSMYVVIRFLAPAFNRHLSLITSSDPGSTPVAVGAVKPARTASPYVLLMARLFTKPGAERAGFLFAWKMTSRSKDFKIKVYPAIGYVVVLAVVMLMNSRKVTLADVALQTASGRSTILVVLYAFSMLLIMAVSQLPFSDKYKAAWFFYITPVEKPGPVIAGAVKAAVVKFFGPMAIVLTVAGVALAGVHLLPNLLLGMANEVLIAGVVAYIFSRKIPFSVLQQTQERSGSFARGILMLMLIFALGLLHRVIYDIFPVVCIVVVLAALAAWLMLDSIRRTGWNELKTGYRDE